MTAPVEPDIREEIDLSWVTFAEEDPTEPCVFHECTSNADWICTALPCGHEYPFCDTHTQYTRIMLVQYDYMTCSRCTVLISDIKYDPIKRG